MYIDKIYVKGQVKLGYSHLSDKHGVHAYFEKFHPPQKNPPLQKHFFLNYTKPV